MAPADVDRNLLFGLLALQTGLIDRPSLALALRTWCADKSREMAQILADQGALPVSRRVILEALVGENLGLHDSDPTRSLAAIEPSPSTVEDLRAIGDVDLDATLDVMGAATLAYPPGRSSQGQSSGSSTGDSKRFRVVRPHRKGGLGVVSVAVDAELNREVALKQILDRHADDPYSRSRFLQEAEITGGLEHPGIVPVYSLGTFGDGRPYYAMRFIKGDTLKDAIADHHARNGGEVVNKPGRSRELELRKLLRRFIDVGNAIEYAHGRGVLHRDLKPSNVMVGKYGETLVVDWGLAKAVGKPDLISPDGEHALFPSHGSGEIETLPGSAIGTPAYMSPEQADGQLDRIGSKSDVYSLGATLYTVLTGHPPYEGPNPRAILEAVRLGQLAPPRQRDPDIDPALEAVCLRAMARQTEDRYPTPAALAEDVERWMADEPVSAFAEPIVRRLSRWGRRNSSIVTGAVVLLVAAVLGLGLVAGLVSRHNTRLEAARLEAKTAGGMAHKAVRTLLSDVVRNELLNIPQGELLRVKLAERALDLYRDFVKLHPTNQDFGLEHARIEEQVASLYRMTGDFAKARVEYEQAIAHLDGLLAAKPVPPEVLEFLAYTEEQFAEMIRMSGGKDAEAEPHYREAVRRAGELRAEHPEVPRYARLLAITSNDLAALLSDSGRLDEALPTIERGVAAARAFRATLPKDPDPSKFTLDWIIQPMLEISYGSVLNRLELGPQAEAVLAPVVESFRTLHTAYPSYNDVTALMVDALEELGEARAADPARIGRGLDDLDEAVTLFTPLPGEFPNVAHYPKRLTALRASRGSIRLRAGRLEPARADLVFAEARLAERVTIERDSADPPRQLGKVKADLARLADHEGRRPEARSLADEAMELQARAIGLDPGRRSDQKLLDRHRTLRQGLEGTSR